MRGQVMFVLDLAVNFLAPWLTYRASRPHVDEAHAIMISAAAPMLWGIAQFAVNRKLDVFSMLSLGGIVLSLAVFAFGGSPKVLLVRESLVTGLLGLVFLGSALIGRPLMFEVMRGMADSLPAGETGALARARRELESFAGEPWFRRIMNRMTIAFGLLGLAEMGARVALALALPTERFLIVSPIVRYTIAGAVVAWLYFTVVPAMRREAARSAES
jgi:hypothetical protein